MVATLFPASLFELSDAVRSTTRLLAVGGGTKPRLSAVDAGKVSTTHLRGILEYDPSEFTFTALAGTPLKEIAAALAERGQYLPFDPLFLALGGTLGGAVAAGLSGPGRLRFGGVRDFILGVRFVDGAGRLLRMGGKVVKNAAGFDLPKFFVGSLGRFGVLAELTFKVFPAPPARLTLRFEVKSAEGATRIFTDAANSRWEPEATDLLPGGRHLCLRLAGPASALEEISREVLARWPGEKLFPAETENVWTDLREFRWAYSDGPLLKVSLTPASLPALDESLRKFDGVRLHVSSGGNVSFISLPSDAQAAALDEQLRKLGLRGVALRGNGPLWYGARNQSKIAEALKKALDPENRFPSLAD